MKTTHQSSSPVRWLAGATLGALLLTSSSVYSQEIPPTPEGVWDCVIGGKSQQGLAVLEFFSDGTLQGFEIITVKGKFNRGGDNTGRDGTALAINRGDSDDFGTNVNIISFGSRDIVGVWAHDPNGRVIGNFIQLEVDETNAVSFSAKVKLGTKKRMTLVSSEPNGRLTYKGVEAVAPPALPDLDGDWQGLKNEEGVLSQEFFTLTSTIPEWPGYYEMDGFGPGYDFVGNSLISIQKKIAFAGVEISGEGTNIITTIRGTMGTYRRTADGLSVKTAKTKGLIEPGVDILYNANPAPLPIVLP